MEDVKRVRVWVRALEREIERWIGGGVSAAGRFVRSALEYGRRKARRCGRAEAVMVWRAVRSKRRRAGMGRQ